LWILSAPDPDQNQLFESESGSSKNIWILSDRNPQHCLQAATADGDANAGDWRGGGEEGGAATWDEEGDETIAAIKMPLSDPD